ncbi:MAG: T9SS type A sorting domain-containing protein [Chitinophagaceae bacterium]
MRHLILIVILNLIQAPAHAQYLVKDINTGIQSSNPKLMGKIQNQLIFFATDNTNDEELWISDGSYNGTRLLKDLYPNRTLRYHSGSCLQIDSLIYFAVSGINNKNALWRTNGTESGTFMLCETFLSVASANNSKIHSFNNKVYFTGYDSAHGEELWVSDGSVVGTKLFSDINTEYGKNSNIADLQTMNGKLYFKANDGVHGMELWESDGTSTRMVIDLYPGTLSGVPDYDYGCQLIPLKNQLYFSGRTDSVGGFELYRSDGTDNGTKLFKDFNLANKMGTYPRINSITDSFFTFYIYDSTNQYRLFRCDGTQGGTYRVGEDKDYPIGLLIDDFYRQLGQTSYFGMCTSAAGCELWVSDGTKSGTKPIMDIASGNNSSLTSEAVIYRNQLIFAAFNQQIGRELWITDGTTTRLLLETLPGNMTSNFLSLYLIDDVLYYSGQSNNSLGLELYAINLAQLLSTKDIQANILAIWPNPVRAGETLNISGQNAFRYTLSDLSGRVLISDYSDNSTIQIPSDMAPGLFLLMTQSDKGVQYTKIQIFN